MVAKEIIIISLHCCCCCDCGAVFLLEFQWKQIIENHAKIVIGWNEIISRMQIPHFDFDRIIVYILKSQQVEACYCFMSLSSRTFFYGPIDGNFMNHSLDKVNDSDEGADGNTQNYTFFYERVNIFWNS